MTPENSHSSSNVAGSWGSPNVVPTMLAQMVLRLVNLPPDAHKDLVRQNALVSLFLGMSCIESFVNAYVTIVADEVGGVAGDALRKAAKAGGPTNAKIESLFKHGFSGKSLGKTDPRWSEYDKMRVLRNQFVHFKTTNTTLHFPALGITMAGLADLSALDGLTRKTPAWVLQTLRGLVELVGEGRGMDSAGAKALAHLYLGIPSSVLLDASL